MKSFAAILVLLALAGCGTNSLTSWFKPEPDGLTVRSVHGEVEYSNGGVWETLRVNMVFTNGAQIRTGHDSEVYFSVGRSAVVKLTVDSELVLTAMMVQRHLFADSTRTVLELRQGAISGSVKKLARESSFQIRGGGLTVENRGGDLRMSADGRVEAVASVNGAVTVQAGGKAYPLQTGEYFDPKKNEVGKLPDRPIIRPDL